MWIERWHVDGFGMWHDVRVEDLPPGLTVIEGPNESGKSTLLAFFRAVLFGFPERRGTYNRYEPLRGGRHGGSLTLRAGSRRYRVTRVPEGGVRGTCQVTDADTGAPLDDSVLEDLLGGITEEVYCNVYGFGLNELQDVGSLEGDRVRDRIFGAALGLGRGVSVAEVERKLSEEAKSFYSPRARATPVNRGLKEHNEIEKKLREIKQRTDEYEDLRRQVTQAQADIAGKRQAQDEAAQRVRDLAQLERAWEPWTELQARRRDLEGLEVIEDFPPDGVARLEQFNEEREKASEEVERIDHQREELERQLGQLRADEALLAHAAEVAALAGERERLRALLGDLPKREQEERAKAERLQAELREIGPDWDEQRLEGYDLSIGAREEVRQRRDRLAAAREEVNRAEDEHRRAQEAVEASQQAAAEAQERRDELRQEVLPEQVLQTRQQAVTSARTALVELRRYEERQRNAQQRADDLRRQRENWEATEPGFSQWSAWLPFILAAVSVVWAVISWGTGIQSWVALGLAAVLVVVGIVAVVGSRRRAQAWQERRTGVLGDLEQRIQDAEQEAEQAQREAEGRRAALRQAGEVLGQEIGDLQAVELAEEQVRRQDEMLQEQQRADQTLAEREQELEQAQAALHIAEQRLQAAREEQDRIAAEWRHWLEEHQLRTGLTADGALDTYHALEKARATLDQLGELRRRREGIESDIEEIEEQARAVLTACRRTVPAREELVGALARLQEELDQARAIRQQREANQKELTRLLGERERWERRLDKRTHDRQDLLDRAGAQNEEEFRKRAEVFAQREALKQSIREAEVKLQGILGSGAELEAKQRRLAATNLDEIRTDLRRAKADQEQREDEYREANTALGELRQRLADIEKSEELSQLLQQREELREQIRAGAREWAVRQTCLFLLQQARERYERERQPRVLQEASNVLPRLTGQSLARLLCRPGEQEITVERPNGTRLNEVQWSRGTKEQIYLAVRLGLIRDFNQRPGAEPLPVIADDIFANFDPQRARAAAEALLELSQQNQVLFLTCHPETAQTLLAVDQGLAHVLLREDGVQRVQ